MAVLAIMFVNSSETRTDLYTAFKGFSSDSFHQMFPKKKIRMVSNLRSAPFFQIIGKHHTTIFRGLFGVEHVHPSPPIQKNTTQKGRGSMADFSIRCCKASSLCCALYLHGFRHTHNGGGGWSSWCDLWRKFLGPYFLEGSPNRVFLLKWVFRKDQCFGKDYFKTTNPANWHFVFDFQGSSNWEKNQWSRAQQQVMNIFLTSPKKKNHMAGCKIPFLFLNGRKHFIHVWNFPSSILCFRVVVGAQIGKYPSNQLKGLDSLPPGWSAIWSSDQ